MWGHFMDKVIFCWRSSNNRCQYHWISSPDGVRGWHIANNDPQCNGIKVNPSTWGMIEDIVKMTNGGHCGWDEFEDIGRRMLGGQ